jgi:hypothetical protein
MVPSRQSASRKTVLAPGAVRKPKLTLNILQSMEDPALFQRWFDGDSWNGWKAVLRAAYGLPMSDEEETFLRAVAERDPPTAPVKELWVGAGRRSGKDSVASLIGAHTAAMFDQGHLLRPGERALVLNLATDRYQAKICLNYTRAFFEQIPMLKQKVERETADGFELSNGIDVVIGTNNFKAVRGRPIKLAILDEVAFYQSENSASPDLETYRALKPGLATLPGSMLIGISSPYRKSGILYSKFKDHFGKDGDILFIRAATRTLNPLIDQSIVDEALLEDPAAAKAEWLGEFRDDVAGYADIAIIEAAVDNGVTVRPPAPGRTYFAGADPSGGQKDSFTCGISHNENGTAVLDCLIEIRAPFNPSVAVDEVAAALRSFGLNSVVGDKYGAAWVIEAFAKVGITYEHSERDRSAIYLDCLPLFTSGRARILDNRRLVNQFASLERRTSPIGKDRVDHGPGGMDDAANSCALAMVLATGDADILADWLKAFGDEEPPVRPPDTPAGQPERIWDAARGVYFYEEVASA